MDERARQILSQYDFADPAAILVAADELAEARCFEHERTLRSMFHKVSGEELKGLLDSIGRRVRIKRQKPNSNWSEGRQGRIHEILPFEDFDKDHEPGACYLVQLDDPGNPGVGLMVDLPGGRKKVRTYPYNAAALEIL